MTTKQIQQQFDVVFAGTAGEYLCIPPVRLRPETVRVVETESRLPQDLDPPYMKTRRVRVVYALPGTISDLVTRSGIRKQTVYSVLRKLRLEGVLKAEKPAGSGVLVYSVRTEG